MFFETLPMKGIARDRLAGSMAAGSPPATAPSFLTNPGQHALSKGFPMIELRSFLRTYSPLFALGAAILGLFVMAVCIGFGINPHG
jgi:hypothetical protein